MKYTKPPKTVEEQADILISRGLSADKTALIECFGNVSYYRLSAYWYPFTVSDSDEIKEGTSLDEVWRNYVFDRQLRLIVMDAIERVEVALKANCTNTFALEHGPFGYSDQKNLPNLKSIVHEKFMEKIEKERKQSNEVFIRHFSKTYTEEPYLPIWMASEIMDFGSAFTLYRGMTFRLKKQIARKWDISANVLQSWLHTFNYVRNLCAHLRQAQ